ncbi:hypothetical protein V8G54_005162 [Vigna mungo]|uniref:SLC26A/SulP transporter domain-containing protein n=1 Tax=Vigna mungo TaxID=3915 RepID=A0AAQ3PJ62_VIGMU
MSVVVIISLQCLTKLLYFTPTAILASIIFSALPGLIDINEAYKIWKVDKLDFLACVGAFFGVIFASVELGLLVAVTATLFNILTVIYIVLIFFLFWINMINADTHPTFSAKYINLLINIFKQCMADGVEFDLLK